MIQEERRFRRPVEPFDDVAVNVDLHDMLQEGRGRSPAPYCHVLPLADWIEDEWIRLRVVSVPHAMSPDFLAHVDAGKMSEHMMSGGTDHRRLCALAAAYLIAVGKKPLVSGTSDCSYAGGWADVAAQDGSLYVECGTLSDTYKPIAAMLHGDIGEVIVWAARMAREACLNHSRRARRARNSERNG